MPARGEYALPRRRRASRMGAIEEEALNPTQGAVMTLADRLRDETRAHHDRLHTLPGYQSLSARKLPPDSHRLLHQGLALLLQDLTWALAATSHPALASVRAEAPPLHPLLEHGLLWEAPRGPLQSQALVGAIALGERMRSAAHREPVSLLGYHYALRLALFPLPDASPWDGLTHPLAGVALEAEQEAGLVRAAGETFSRVRTLLDALHPPRDRPPTYWLNRDAGSHPITMDPDELRAALRAAAASWEEFPYYAWRFGDRGRQFCDSDSAWLVTLRGHAEPQVWKHISWLGGLLAARGMPRLMLERHLRRLHQELVRAKPEHPEAHDVLRRVAERLAEERRQFLDDLTLRTLGEDFDARVGPDWSHRLRGTGELLASAVADECGGHTQTVPSLASWLGEPSRFPAPWLHAVAETLHQARRHCQGPTAPVEP